MSDSALKTNPSKLTLNQSLFLKDLELVSSERRKIFPDVSLLCHELPESLSHGQVAGPVRSRVAGGAGLVGRGVQGDVGQQEARAQRH